MKKMLSVMLALCLVLVLGACSQGYDVSEDPEFFADDEEIVLGDGTEFDNELDLLMWEPNEENSENFYLLRNDVNYSLGSVDPEKAIGGVLPVTGIGLRNHGGCSVQSGLMVTLPDYVNNGLFTYGNVPILTFEPGDKIVSYSQKAIPDLQLRKVVFYGYAVRLYIINKGENSRYDILDDEQDNSIYPSDNIEIKDSSGNTLDELFDVYNLNEGEKYTISWYKGTQYNEATLLADSKYYILEGDRLSDPDYSISGTLTKNGYAEYDVSGVAPGTYLIISTNDGVTQSFINIK